MTQTVTVTPTVPGAAGPNDAALAAKMDAASAPPAPPAAAQENTAERPAWLPEKFKTPEDFAKAYSELEKKQSGAKTEATPPAADTTKAGEAAPDDAAKALADKGLDMSKFSAEFDEKGELSAESFDALAKAGIPKEMVDSYIAGQKAQADALITEMHGLAGGKEGFNAMSAWAAASLTEAELSAYNDAVTQSPAAARLAVAGLHARFTASEGKSAARTVSGNGNAGGSTDEYPSWEQAKADMKDPRYSKDPAFRSQVEQKIGRSKVLR